MKMEKLKVDKDTCRKFKGKFNYIGIGKLIENPNFIFELRVDGKKSPQRRGDFDATTDHFDYMVHDIKDVTLGQKLDYYKKHKVEVIVHHVKDCKHVTSVFKATPKGWVVTKEGLHPKKRR